MQASGLGRGARAPNAAAMAARAWLVAAVFNCMRCTAPIALLALACALALPIQAAETYAEEDRSWGVEPPPGYRAKDYHAPTPDALPGARIVRTAELKEMLERDPRPFLVDVLSGPVHRSLPGALWLHNGGLGDFDAAEEQRFLDVLARLSGHDKAREIVFFCSGSHCWLSYNAALRATRAGYTNVYWYRGGIEAWREAGLPTRTTDNFQW
jgi:PQQ-dependent catabolism-associated CXXCW motif protein